jgi:hypothetical protein
MLQVPAASLCHICSGYQVGNSEGVAALFPFQSGRVMCLIPLFLWIAWVLLIVKDCISR